MKLQLVQIQMWGGDVWVKRDSNHVSSDVGTLPVQVDVEIGPMSMVLPELVKIAAQKIGIREVGETWALSNG